MNWTQVEGTLNTHPHLPQKILAIPKVQSLLKWKAKKFFGTSFAEMGAYIVNINYIIWRNAEIFKNYSLFFKEGKKIVKENGESFGIFYFFNMETSNKSETRRFLQIIEFFY